MKISKLTWMVTARTRLSLSIPAPLRERVTITDVDGGFEVAVDGVGTTRAVVDGGLVSVEGCGHFSFGSNRKGNQMEDLDSALRHQVFRALGLRQGWCGNWGYQDGSRLDGRGKLVRAPIEESMDIMDALDREEEPVS